MKTKLMIVTGALALTNLAQAGSFAVYDARSLGMGGTGVASALPGVASYYNPALLSAARPQDDFSLEASTYVRAADPNNVRQAFSDFSSNHISSVTNASSSYNTAWNTLSATVNASNLSAWQTASTNLSTALNSMLTDLNKLSNKGIVVDLNAGATMAVPSKKLGVGILAGATSNVGFSLNITSNDTSTINSFVTALNSFASVTTGTVGSLSCTDTNIYVNSTASDCTMKDFSNSMTSGATILGSSITESGVSLSTVLYGMAVGITTKSQTVNTYDYSISLKNSSTTVSNAKSYSDSNMDIGVVMPISEHWQVGVVGKNIMEKSYLTAQSNTITVKPQYRTGIAYNGSWFTVAADMDLTESDAAGFEKKSKYLGAGAEFDLSLLQLRAGFSKNLSDANPAASAVSTFGAGLYLIGLNLDLGAAISSNETSVALQLGLQF